MALTEADAASDIRWEDPSIRGRLPKARQPVRSPAPKTHVGRPQACFCHRQIAAPLMIAGMEEFVVRPAYVSGKPLIEFRGEHRSDSFPKVLALLERFLPEFQAPETQGPSSGLRGRAQRSRRPRAPRTNQPRA